MSKAMRQMLGQPGLASVTRGEALCDLASDEAWIIGVRSQLLTASHLRLDVRDADTSRVRCNDRFDQLKLFAQWGARHGLTFHSLSGLIMKRRSDIARQHLTPFCRAFGVSVIQ